VIRAIEAYSKGERISTQALDNSKRISLLGEEVEELAVELLARYQPVATDLRYIKSVLEISYGFTRFGRYAFDIAQVLEMAGDLSACDKTIIEHLSEHVDNMIRDSILSLKTRDEKLARSLRDRDEEVDRTYRDVTKRLFHTKSTTVECALASTLVLRYLERIADHACHIGDSVIYITTGKKI
jgi:phosphate transport system protein